MYEFTLSLIDALYKILNYHVSVYLIIVVSMSSSSGW